jgi:hypothetical protein
MGKKYYRKMVQRRVTSDFVWEILCSNLLGDAFRGFPRSLKARTEGMLL